MSWALLVKGRELADAWPGGPGVVRFAPAGSLRLANTETGEIREWGSGLDALMEVYDGDAELLGRVAEALGPDVLGRWRDGAEGLDLAAEVAELRGIVEAVEGEGLDDYLAREYGPALEAEQRRRLADAFQAGATAAAVEVRELRKRLAAAEGTAAGYRAALAERFAGPPDPPRPRLVEPGEENGGERP